MTSISQDNYSKDKVMVKKHKESPQHNVHRYVIKINRYSDKKKKIYNIFNRRYLIQYKLRKINEKIKEFISIKEASQK